MRYSKEDRERILADFAESGMSANRFCAQPGRPGSRALGRWLRQAEAGELDVPEREVRGRVAHERYQRYPSATVDEALRLYDAGMRPCDITRRLGLRSRGSVGFWVARRERERAGGATIGAKEAVAMDGAEDMPEGRPPEKRGAKRGRAGKAAPSAREAELEAELEAARTRIAVLEEMVRDPKAGDPERLSNRRKAELGERLRRDCGFSLSRVLTSLRISKSSYEYARGALERDRARDAEVDARVRAAFEAGRGTYGYRRVSALASAGPSGEGPMHVSERAARRSMRRQGLAVRRRGRAASFSSYAGEVDERPANVPLRPDGTHDFHAEGPDELVVTDVTEFKVAGGAKVYLSPVIDCYDGMPVSWSISTHPDSGLCDSSLASYLEGLPEGHAALTVHTDGGGTYRSSSWKELCRLNGAERSMSRKSCCPDNARAEGFFGTLKREFYHGRDWSHVGVEEFEDELEGYMRWYAGGRLKLFEEDGGRRYDTIEGHRKRMMGVV